jgi:protein-S-isoprenylcysteine O-methyltransferase Ste14
MITYERFTLICWIWIGFALVLFPILLKVTQPYGRHSNTQWGRRINNKLGWFLMELPALVVFGFFLSFAENLFDKLVLAAGLLWALHYVHRSLIFPFQLHPKGKKIPIVIVVFGILFNTMNGFLNGYWLVHFSVSNESSLWLNLHILIGVILFIVGYSINKYHDRLLIKLRNGKNEGYQIPFGGLFRYVSCPNYLGEIITWLGFFVVTLSLPALSFLVWTMVNLIPRALDNHKWYKKEFPDYPATRKAVLPFLL